MSAEYQADQTAPEEVPARAAAAAQPQQTDSTINIPDDALIVLPVRGMVLFPGTVLPIAVSRRRSVAAVQQAARSEKPIGVLLQRDEGVEDPGPLDLHRIGTVATILRYVTAPDGVHHIIGQGHSRLRVVDFLEGYPFIVARIERIEEPVVMTREIEARVHRLKEQAAEAVRMLPQAPSELAGAIQAITSPSNLADVIASFMDVSATEKQDVLKTIDLQTRLDKVLAFLAHRLEVLRLSQQIGEQTKESLEQHQREYFLREQLKTIQKELGETDETHTEIEELRKASPTRRCRRRSRRKRKKELSRLERMPEAAAEYSHDAHLPRLAGRAALVDS